MSSSLIINIVISQVTMMLLKTLIITQVLAFCACQSVDLTIVPESSGTAVVFASVSRIQLANIFPDDNRLLRRVAYVETRDGVDSDTYRYIYIYIYIYIL